MKLEELQKKLDEKKYFVGVEQGCDPAGKMLHCDSCEYGTRDFKCSISHEERVAKCACAKAYRERKRKKK